MGWEGGLLFGGLLAALQARLQGAGNQLQACLEPLLGCRHCCPRLQDWLLIGGGGCASCCGALVCDANCCPAIFTLQDWLLMEEEFVQNQERLKPADERNEEERTKVGGEELLWCRALCIGLNS